MKIHINKSGLALAEALMAVALLAVGAIIMGTVVQSGISSTRAAKEYLLAQNLVTEGIESVKNIRNTNWLRNPLEPECWLNLNPSETVVCSELAIYQTVDPAIEYNYISQEQENGLWILSAVTGNVSLNLEESGGNTIYQLYLIKEEAGGGQSFMKYTTSTDGEVSPYYRSVEFIYADYDMAIFEVKVQWESESKTKTIARQVQIFNYYNP
ncbi:hypothetical protein ACFL21_02220 [Patescibacteria group bacterium]